MDVLYVQMTPWHGLIADMVRCKSLSICCLLTTHTTYCPSSLYLFTASVFRSYKCYCRVQCCWSHAHTKKCLVFVAEKGIFGRPCLLRWKLGVADRGGSVDEKSIVAQSPAAIWRYAKDPFTPRPTGPIDPIPSGQRATPDRCVFLPD
ncbi:hypothetical protein BDA96_06G179400 [Sorghum bicolor]|uniref:Uncharacterized protein n=2 Tax=Sorghum bicolor TaxID=4558 RepID=A0A921QTM5_SORBI|nr:hypothetical protein BDA96_06G179400 [Sorghum bicolor]OQU82038.1 hypothetical protein SORBI_3006G163033 [Sorghum bicolor]